MGGSCLVIGSSPVQPTTADVELAALDQVLAERTLRSVYQPIVELATGAVVGYEALARGPQGSPMESPDALFATARRAGRLAELDRACRKAALSGASDAELFSPWTLFVNIEPATAHDAFLPGTLAEDAHLNDARDDRAFRVVVELTERALTTDPTQLLEVVARIRARGWGIALDDVGANRDSLALLPLLRPDIIKLDLRLIHEPPTAEIAEIVCAVNAEAERSGTAVLAEGIENEEHLEVARGLGATLGQGWMLGRPAALPEPLLPRTGDHIVIASQVQATENGSPFAMGAAVHTPRVARKPILIEFSKYLERQAMQSGEATVVLATFQDFTFFNANTRQRYAQLTRGAAFVGALGKGMPSEPMPGVRGGALEPGDPLLEEWDIAVVGPHFAATLVARDLGDGGPSEQRRFDYVLSHNRELAIAVATTLISRIRPLS